MREDRLESEVENNEGFSTQPVIGERNLQCASNALDTGTVSPGPLFLSSSLTHSQALLLSASSQ